MMMMAWVFPARVLPINRRESMLIAIDALGKWSLVDTFIMVMFQIAFHFKVQMPVPVTVPGQPDVNDTLAVELRVQSDWGFTGFMIATMLSLFMSHVIVGAHRTAIAEPSPRNVQQDKVAVAGHTYTSNSGHGVRVTVWGKTLFTLLLSLTIALVAYGMMIDSFSFNFFGLVGCVATPPPFLLIIARLLTPPLHSSFIYPFASQKALFHPPLRHCWDAAPPASLFSHQRSPDSVVFVVHCIFHTSLLLTHAPH